MKISNICCIGAGYVGGPTMAVIALKCPTIKVTVVDENKDKIKAWNSNDLDKLPVFEPGLKKLISKTRNKNLFFSNKIEKSIQEAEIIFMAVNTPTKTYGEGKGMAADLTFVEKCARKIAEVSNSDKIVVEKSTLPVRTAEKIKEVLIENNSDISFEVISNPEFLAEGTAIEDLYKSDRVLIGGDNTKSGERAVKKLISIYKNWIPEHKILTTNVWSSELSKLASNAMLAQRVSSINSLSALCEKTGADINEVSNAIGMDSRIGTHFLKASVGFGGSCFQKDILNLVYLCKYYGLEEVAEYWMQVIKINNYQRDRFSRIIIDGLNGTVNQKTITLLGWAFKKNTNDSRESSSIYIARNLIEEGAFLNIFDPMVEKKKIVNDLRELWLSDGIKKSEIKVKLNQLKIHKNHKNAFKSSYAVAILTEWDEFKNYKWEKLIKDLKKPVRIFDGRNILNKNKVLNKIYKIGIG